MSRWATSDGAYTPNTPWCADRSFGVFITTSACARGADAPHDVIVRSEDGPDVIARSAATKHSRSCRRDQATSFVQTHSQPQRPGLLRHVARNDIGAGPRPMPLTLYPAIDLKDGKCVRLRRGEMDQATVYADDPAAQARAWQDAGFTWLH